MSIRGFLLGVIGGLIAWFVLWCWAIRRRHYEKPPKKCKKMY